MILVVLFAFCLCVRGEDGADGYHSLSVSCICLVSPIGRTEREPDKRSREDRQDRWMFAARLLVEGRERRIQRREEGVPDKSEEEGEGIERSRKAKAENKDRCGFMQWGRTQAYLVWME